MKRRSTPRHSAASARAEGRVARSGDLNSAGLFLGSLLVLVFTGGALLDTYVTC